jgi:glycerol-3-phosphate dehydrogenase
MPHDPSMRPVWMIRIGLFLYDHLAHREVLPPSRTVDLRQYAAGAPLKPQFTKGFVYSDGWVDDARLVALCALDAAERGATVLTRTTCVDAVRGEHRWRVTLKADDGATREVSARALVNAAGPWAAQFLMEHAHAADRVHLRLVKGSHIVVKKLFEHDHAYIFQNADGRVIFVIPYEHDFTLVGTTDIEHHGAIGEARAEPDEIAYLCEQASHYLARPVTPDQVVWTYSGVRPLIDDESGNPAAVTRDYRLELDSGEGGARQAPLLSVWGGKITTFRKLAEEAADGLVPLLSEVRADETTKHPALGGAWTATATLPGGDLHAWLGASAPAQNDLAATVDRFVVTLARRHPSLPSTLLLRLAHAYGTRVEAILDGDLGREIAPLVFEAELAYLRRVEWARRGDDVLWRRSKLGLHLQPAERDAVAAWMERAGS